MKFSSNASVSILRTKTTLAALSIFPLPLIRNMASSIKTFSRFWDNPITPLLSSSSNSKRSRGTSWSKSCADPSTSSTSRQTARKSKAKPTLRSSSWTATCERRDRDRQYLWRDNHEHFRRWVYHEKNNWYRSPSKKKKSKTSRIQKRSRIVQIIIGSIDMCHLL